MMRVEILHAQRSVAALVGVNAQASTTRHTRIQTSSPIDRISAMALLERTMPGLSV
jgi:hypothetical protein